MCEDYKKEFEIKDMFTKDFILMWFYKNDGCIEENIDAEKKKVQDGIIELQ